MNSIPLDIYEAHREEFETYRDLLLKWNEKINLTAITEPDKIREFHFLDSLFLLRYLGPGGIPAPEQSVLDIGSGNGLPGLALKVACPDLEVTLVESKKKKCDFMKTVIRTLGLKKVAVLHQTLREGVSVGRFGVVVSRATLSMRELIRLAVSNLKPGGRIIGMKGLEVSREIMNCRPLLGEYRLSPIQEEIYTLPSSREKRKLLILVAHGPCPPG